MPTIAGLFNKVEDARGAVQELVDAGWSRSDIGIIAQTLASEADDDNLPIKDAEKGALVGGLAGLLLGISELAVPGVGLVLVGGWLAATLFGASIGAAAGGLVGALVEAGLTHHEAERLEHGVRAGATLVTVKSATAKVDRISEILLRHGAANIELTQTTIPV